MPDFSHAIEDYLASLPDEDWQALTARVRPPAEPPADEPDIGPGKGTIVPGVGGRPSGAPSDPQSQIRIAEQAGDWKQAMALKAQMLTQQPLRQS